MATGLLTVGLGTVSCTKSKQFDLYDYQVSTLQISSFTLGSASNAALKTYKFSIRNSEGEGSISNGTPLPYGTELRDVTLNITPVNSAAKITVSLDGSTYSDWKSTTTYTISDTQQHLYVRVSLEGSSAAYTYKVTLHEYTNDPRTISWQTNGSAPSDAAGIGSPTSIVNYGDGYLLIDGKSQTTQRPRYYAIVPSAAAVFPPDLSLGAELTLTGLDAAETIVHTHAYAGTIYAVTSAHRLYRLSGTAWTAVATDRPVLGLLGVLPPRTSGDAPTLALMVQDTGGAPRFARLEQTTLTVSSAQVPSTFPLYQDLSARYTSESTTLTYIGAAIRLIGAECPSGASETYRTTWYTTNGLDWLNLSTQTVTGGRTLLGFSVIYGLDALYRLETYADGVMEVYMSRDGGKSWETSSAVSLDGLDQSKVTNRNFVAWPHAGTIYMIAGVNSAGDVPASLWAGIPRNNDY